MAKIKADNANKLQGKTSDDIVFRAGNENGEGDKIVSRRIFLDKVLADTMDLSEGAIYTMRKIVENTKEFRFSDKEEALLMVVTNNEYTVSYKPILKAARLLVG